MPMGILALSSVPPCSMCSSTYECHVPFALTAAATFGVHPDGVDLHPQGGQDLGGEEGACAPRPQLSCALEPKDKHDEADERGVLGLAQEEKLEGRP